MNKIQENDEIIININEANKAQKYQTKEELFQIEAFKRVTEILKEHAHGYDTKNIVDCRFHDTIFIDGNRGIGKTAFMLNIEKYYNEFREEDIIKNDNKYIFLNPIDPTLLEHTEKFLSVVLARIVEKVTDSIDENKMDNKILDNYYKALEKLSKSLSAIKTLDDDLGIEEIASSKSSLKLEQHSHDFFKIVCSLFNNSHALVMLIDDVDMAFDKGFDVLEVVRKYLASPYLIPIVAGDMKLYKEIVKTRFHGQIEYLEDIKSLNILNSTKNDIKIIDEYTEKKELIANLVEQYLHKVFPSEYHIQLKNIYKILKEEYVTIVFNKELKVSYNDIKNFEIRHINLGINQVEFTFQIFSDNTRDLIQYLHSKKNIYVSFFLNFKDYIFKKQKDLTYSPQNIDLKLDMAILEFINKNENNLYEKSIYKSSEFYKFSNDRKKKELSILTQNDYLSFESNKYNLYKAFTNDGFRLLSKFKNLEKSVDKYSIKSDGLQVILNKDYKYKDVSNYIIDLFIFNDYYSSYQRRNYIYAGKFLESIICSFSFKEDIEEITKNERDEINEIIDDFLKNYDENDKKDLFQDFTKFYKLNDEIYSIIYDKNSNDATNKELSDKFNEIKGKYNFKEKVEYLKRITLKIPFASEFLHNNRYKNEDFYDDDSNEINETTNKYNLNDLSIEIAIWRSVFLDSIELNSLSLYEIIYKFFANIEKIKLNEINDLIEVIDVNGRKLHRRRTNKVELKELKENKPIIYIRRIVLILINAIAYFENSNEKVANVNIAINEEFNLENILSKTSASLQNIKPMFNKKNSLTRALFFHPIISQILFSEDESKLNDLEFVNQKRKNIINNLDEKKDEQKNKIKLSNLLSNRYKKYFREDPDDKTKVILKDGVEINSLNKYFDDILKFIKSLQNNTEKEIVIELLEDKDLKFFKADRYFIENDMLFNFNVIESKSKLNEYIKNNVTE